MAGMGGFPAARCREVRDLVRPHVLVVVGRGIDLADLVVALEQGGVARGFETDGFVLAVDPTGAPLEHRSKTAS